MRTRAAQRRRARAGLSRAPPVSGLLHRRLCGRAERRSIRAAQREALHSVRAQSQSQGLERYDVGGHDVAQVALRAEALEQPDLLLAQRRLEDQAVRVDRVDDLVDQARAHLSRGAVDARGARLARLCDHLPRACCQIAFDLLDPYVGSHDEVGVLAADLGEYGELLRQRFDQLALELGCEGDRAVGDLDMAETELAQPRDQALDATLADRNLRERAAEHHGYPVRRVALELGAQVGGNERSSPAELDDVDELAGDLQETVDVRERHAAVDHVRDASLAGLARALGDVEETG